MQEFSLIDIIELKKDIGCCGLPVGSTGKIIDYDKKENMYKIEFFGYPGYYWCKNTDITYFIPSEINQKELKQDPGNKFDGEKLRLDLLSFQAIQGTADVLTFGAKKYGDRNWENGLSFSRVFGALLRHLFAWWLGKDNDDETGLSHLDHAACCLMFLQHYSKNKKYKKFDDRIK